MKKEEKYSAAYAGDARAGVQNLIERYRRRKEALKKERTRLAGMMIYEKKYREYGRLCGIDEAGRGPLAGPVVAGAVILPENCEILGINDSKKLTAKKREVLYDEIMEKAVAVSTGIVSPQRIDEINILQATYEAMREAVAGLGTEPDLLLNDAVTIPEVIIPQVPIVKGDAKSVSIAAASIIAKSTRDRIMLKYENRFPDMDLLRIRVMVRQSISKRFAVWGLLRFTGTALSVILSEAASVSEEPFLCSA